MCAAVRRNLRPVGPAADVRGEPGQARHRLHRDRRCETWCGNRYFGLGPGYHDAAAGRPGKYRRGFHPARSRCSVAGQGRRCAAPPRSHRGRRRPGPDGGTATRRRDLRDRQPKGRGLDGPDRRVAGLRRRTWPCADHHRRLDRVAPQAREAHQRIAEARIPTRHGEFRAIGYASIYEDVEHVALVRGEISGPTATATTCWSACTPSA